MAARAKISLLSCALALVVAGCGSGGDGTIPPESSDRLLTLLAAIEGEISGGECDLARQHADEFVAAVEELPSDVDPKVADELTTAADNLDQLAGEPDECTDSGASGPEGVEPATSTPTTTEEPETTDDHDHDDRGGADDDRGAGGARGGAAGPQPRADRAAGGERRRARAAERRGRRRRRRQLMAPQSISDRYELGDRLGSGGMSTVYRATDRVLERTVAVKILAEHLSDDDKFVARFRREALAVAKLIHPNIVQVYDTGVDADRHYIVMEYVEGKSVAQLLQTKGRLGAESTTEIGMQACAGLEYAHRQGIIHRDVKPGNLMVIGGPAGRRRRDSSAHEPPTGEMTIKLTDFGIARATAQIAADPGRLGGRHRRLPGARAGARRGGDARGRRLRARRRPLPAAHRAAAVGGIDARRARDPAREREPAAADLLRPRRSRDPVGGRAALARGRGGGALLVGARPLAGARCRAARARSRRRRRTSCPPTCSPPARRPRRPGGWTPTP